MRALWLGLLVAACTRTVPTSNGQDTECRFLVLPSTPQCHVVVSRWATDGAAARWLGSEDHTLDAGAYVTACGEKVGCETKDRWPPPAESVTKVREDDRCLEGVWSVGWGICEAWRSCRDDPRLSEWKRMVPMGFHDSTLGADAGCVPGSGAPAGVAECERVYAYLKLRNSSFTQHCESNVDCQCWDLKNMTLGCFLPARADAGIPISLAEARTVCSRPCSVGQCGSGCAAVCVDGACVARKKPMRSVTPPADDDE